MCEADVVVGWFESRDLDDGEPMIHVVICHEGDAVVAMRDPGAKEGEVEVYHSGVVLWRCFQDEMADCSRGEKLGFGIVFQRAVVGRHDVPKLPPAVLPSSKG